MTEPKKNKKERKTSKAKATTPRSSLSSESDELVFAVCERFFNQLDPTNTGASSAEGRRKGPASAVADWLKKERNRPDLNREKIYPLVWEAFRRKYLLLHAPIEYGLQDKIIERYKLQNYLASKRGDVVVTNVSGSSASTHVGLTAADLIIKLIDQVDRDKKSKAIAAGEDPENVRVHLGIGAGFIAETVAKRLSDRANADLPKLTLHAITPGGYYTAGQQKDTSTYFSFFVEKNIDVQCVGFFSTPVVMAESLNSFQRNPSLRDSFKTRNEIDIVVTSLAAADDDHGLMKQYFTYLNASGLLEEDVVKTLEAQDWVGDLLFQPYSSKKAIYPKTVRTVALFNFEELVEFSRTPGKYVVLTGGPCVVCNATKTAAIRPLLTEESMRAWTHLVLDRDAASELL